MSNFAFLKEFEKEIKTLKSVGGDVETGRYWISFGNYVLNRVLSGEFSRGIAQGTGMMVAGFSGCLPAGEQVRIYQLRSLVTASASSQWVIDEATKITESVEYTVNAAWGDFNHIAELQHFYTADEFKIRFGTTYESIALPEHSSTLYVVLEKHCSGYSEMVNIETLVTPSQSPFLISTPDGFQAVTSTFIKSPRPIYRVATSDYAVRCSADHLFETKDGWVPANQLNLLDRVLTARGFQPVTECQWSPGHEVVYDFTVAHPNQRYWAGGGFSAHNTGKSFIAGNVIREAQQAGAFNLILDSENALDSDYLTKIGVKYDSSILRKRVVKITDSWSLLRAFLDGYVSQYGDDLTNAPKIHITIDSLGFLMTDSDYDHANDGTFKADQGATKRLIKDLLKKLTHAIAGMNITYVCTDQVYQARAEQIMAGTAINGAVLNEQVKFAFHQIAYLSRLKLKDDKTKLVTGIRLKVAAAKTRFTQPFGQIELEVPYETGIDPFNGLLEVAVSLGVVEKRGSRYVVAGETNTWFSKDFAAVANDVLVRCELLRDATINVDTGLELEAPEPAKHFERQKRVAEDLLTSEE